MSTGGNTLLKFIFGQTSEEENVFVESWIKESDNNKHTLDYLRENMGYSPLRA